MTPNDRSRNDEPSPDHTPDRLIHPAVARDDGEPLSEARLTDKQRVAILLQVIALVEFLGRISWHLPRGWSAVRVDKEKVVVGVEALPGRSDEMPQRLLRDFVGRLFGSDGSLPGRGPARKATRVLVDSWEQNLTQIAPEMAVARLLEVAPFLWEQEFTAARRTMIAERERDGERGIMIAGPAPCRRRLLSVAETAGELRELLASTAARSVWEGTSDAEPKSLAAAGRWRAAVAAWGQNPPRTKTERLAQAEALFSLGRFRSCLDVLKNIDSPSAEVLSIRCRYCLGEKRAVSVAIKRLSSRRLDSLRIVQVAELLARVSATDDEEGLLKKWVEDGRQSRDLSLRARSHLAGATFAWRRRRLDQVEEQLDLTESSRSLPGVDWRWFQIAGLAGQESGDGARVVRFLGKALSCGRRQLRLFDAASLWSDLGVGRVFEGDLSGAERAFVHAARLFSSTDCSSMANLALFNLADVRLRQGRLKGVRRILRASKRENTQADQSFRTYHDVATWARFELVLGRPSAALALIENGLRSIRTREMGRFESLLSLLAARALGWMDEPARAASFLERCEEKHFSELEKEEIVPLFLHAGQKSLALKASDATDFHGLWEKLLNGEVPHAGQWSVLEELEPFRFARLVFDFELCFPRSVPADFRRLAFQELSRFPGHCALPYLEMKIAGGWSSLETLLSAGHYDNKSIRDLFESFGLSVISLEGLPNHDGQLPAEFIADEAAGEEVEAEGQFVLRYSGDRAIARALLRLIVVLTDMSKVEAPEVAVNSKEGGANHDIVGNSVLLATALQRLKKFAVGSSPVLITGESGTGKELAAQSVHRVSKRRHKKFLPINCAAVSENLLLSELFGHARGSFTGADRDRAGVFEVADGGTVFLDEIGDLPLAAQGMLLRVLQEGEVRRVGESMPRKIDARVVAATHQPLEAMVEDGRFRQDLYYRLKVATVELPPLRERGDDVLLLADHFLTREGRRLKLEKAARDRLRRHSWPGNVRELFNVLASASALAEGSQITEADLDLPQEGSAPVGGYHQQIEAFRRELIVEALRRSGGNRAEAARCLGLSRQALSYQVRQLKIT